MTPRAFMALTASEYYALLDGWKWRDQYQQETIARWVASLINGLGWTKRAVTPEQLLGRPLTAGMPPRKPSPS